jgi:hypothetical protein
MTSKLHPPRPICWLAAGATAIALAAPSASAVPVERFLDSPSGCETQVVAKYRVPARVPPPSSCVEPAPARPSEVDTFPGTAAAARDAFRVESSDPGFGWASAVVGASGAAGLIALVSLMAPAVRSRRRVRTAR